MIPPPNVLLDNFMNQIKGIPAVTTTSSNPDQYDYSFKYNPYYDGLGGGVDKFESLEDSAARMTSTIDLSTQGNKILTAAEVTQQTVDAKKNETMPNLDAAIEEADSTSKETGGDEKEESQESPTPPTSAPTQRRGRSNNAGSRSSSPLPQPKQGDRRGRSNNAKSRSSSPPPQLKQGGRKGR
jgi:hypothetical protein